MLTDPFSRERCQLCGRTGHRKKSCPLAPASASAPKSAKVEPRKPKSGSGARKASHNPSLVKSEYGAVLAELDKHREAVAEIQVTLRDSFAALENDRRALEAESQRLAQEALLLEERQGRSNSNIKGKGKRDNHVLVDDAPSEDAIRWVLGGTTFYLTIPMLERFPDSLFGKMTAAQLLRANAEHPNRDPRVFALICDWLREGVLKVDLEYDEAKALHQEVRSCQIFFFVLVVSSSLLHAGAKVESGDIDECTQRSS